MDFYLFRQRPKEIESEKNGKGKKKKTKWKENELVYVADYITPEGELLAIIDSKGEGEGLLYHPYGLCE